MWRIEHSILKLKPDWYGNVVKRTMYLALRYFPAVCAAASFASERKHYLNLTRRYETHEQLRDDQPVADLYMTGSDQLWGPVVDGSHDGAYCLSFTKDDDKRVAYAASFGRNSLTEQEQGHYKKWLSRFSAITVREVQAVELLKEIDVPAQQVLDPTLLLDGNEWLELMDAAPRKGKYILVYQLHSNPRLDAYAQKVAQAKGLPLYRVSPSLHQMTRPGKFVWLPKTKSFLSYLAGAECLITDSFHGTAFAINFGVPFVDVYSKNGTESRILSILKTLGLSDRILPEGDDVTLADKPIDYEKVHQIVAQKRQESIQLLQQMLDAK